jgi:hypothetical protein
MKKKLADFYLDRLNNFKTVAAFAAHHEMDEADATILLALGHKFHEERASRARNGVLAKEMAIRGDRGIPHRGATLSGRAIRSSACRSGYPSCQCGERRA